MSQLPATVTDPELELPTGADELPGPQSRAWFDRADQHLTGTMADHELVPFVAASRRGHLVVDADGNTFADHMSAWGASPFGPTPESVRVAMDEAWREHGMQISGWVQNPPALELVEKLARDRAGPAQPGRVLGDRHARGRGRGEVHARGDRSPPGAHLRWSVPR